MAENLRLCRVDDENIERELFYFHAWEERAEKHWHPENPQGDLWTKYHVGLLENVRTGEMVTRQANTIIFIR